MIRLNGISRVLHESNTQPCGLFCCMKGPLLLRQLPFQTLESLIEVSRHPVSVSSVRENRARALCGSKTPNLKEILHAWPISQRIPLSRPRNVFESDSILRVSPFPAASKSLAAVG